MLLSLISLKKFHIFDLSIKYSSFQRLIFFSNLLLISYMCGHTMHLLADYLSSVQSFSCACLFVTPWTAACQAVLSITNSWSLFKLMSIESMMSPNHFIPCRPLLLLSSVFPSIRVFSNESVLHIRWPKYWSFSFSISLPWIFRTDFL